MIINNRDNKKTTTTAATKTIIITAIIRITKDQTCSIDILKCFSDNFTGSTKKQI